MLIIGPGFGHNVDSVLSRLKDSTEFDVSYWANTINGSFLGKYPFINFIYPSIILDKKHPFQVLLTFLTAIKIIWRKDFDVIYSLGQGSYLTAFVFFISRNKTKKALEIWSNHIIWNASRNKTIKDKCDKYVIDKADYICQYWWGVREQFVNTFPQYENKFLMYPKSYADIFFSDEKHSPSSDFVKDFLNKIPNNYKVCFWPRSFIPSNNHKLLLDALGLIKKERPQLLENFKLYLWGGNVEYSSCRASIESAIVDNSLIDLVEIVDHPFVPQNDIFAIEERSDFFVQIANDDILSSYIMEMICSKKPFILSNLRTFQFLNEKYDLKIDLVENEKSIIAERIIDILLGNTNYAELEWRKKRCSHLFSRSNVMPWYTVFYNTITN